MANITTCLWCGKDSGTFIGLKPCKNCQKEMKKGITVIITSSNDPAFKKYFEVKDAFTHMGKYLTKWFVLDKKKFTKLVKKNMKTDLSEEELQAIIKKGYLWVKETGDDTILNVFPEKHRLHDFSNVPRK